MTRTEYSPPYRAHKSCGQWYVLNSQGGYEVACDCRHHAEEVAREMNEDAAHNGDRPKFIKIRLYLQSREQSDNGQNQ